MYWDNSTITICTTDIESLWSVGFFLVSILVFFCIPLFILIVLYAVIASNLMEHSLTTARNGVDSSRHHRARRQVVLMLGTVVISFFICLLPYRAFIVYIMLAPSHKIQSLGPNLYYSAVYFFRFMFYLNSAINPILYNLMSSKFRKGSLRLCSIEKSPSASAIFRKGTFTTSTTGGGASAGLTSTTNFGLRMTASPEQFWRLRPTNTMLINNGKHHHHINTTTHLLHESFV